MRDKVAAYGFFHRVENSAALGTGDVYFAIPSCGGASFATSGWIELKHLHEFPARHTTPIIINHLTIDQVRFLEAVANNGAKAFTLLRIRTTYFLLDAPLIRGVYSKTVCEAELRRRALMVEIGAFPTRKLIRALVSL